MHENYTKAIHVVTYFLAVNLFSDERPLAVFSRRSMHKNRMGYMKKLPCNDCNL